MPTMCILLVALSLTARAHAATYTATPSTFAAMLSRLGPGDTLQLQPGTYPPIRSETHRLPSGTSWADAPRILGGPGVVVRGLGLREVRWLIFANLVIDCAGQTREGVYISTSAHHIRVQDAEIKHCTAQGILVPKESGGFNEFLRLNVHHNGSRSHFHHGIYIAAAHNTVAHSHIHHNAGYGVHVYNNGPRTANGNLIQFNRIEHNGTLGSTTYGLLLSSGHGNRAIGNVVHTNGTGDIRVSTTASGSMLADNQTGVADVLQSPVSGDTSDSMASPQRPPLPLAPLPAPRHLRLLRP